MGLLCELFIANEDQAEKLAQDRDAFSNYEKLSMKGLTNIELESLGEIVSGQLIELTLVNDSSDNGPWVFKLPDELTIALAALKDKNLSGIAEHWAATEELTMGNVTPQIAEQTLLKIVTLAEKAVSVHKGLLLWVCL